MTTEKPDRIGNGSLATGVLAAFAASLCCIGPVAAALLGTSSLAALVKYESFRPAFTAVTVVTLAYAFYAAYRKPNSEACTDGSVCETQGGAQVRRLNRVVVWVVASIAVVVLTFPSWSSIVLG